MQQKQLKPNATSDLSTWLCYLEQIHPKTIELGLARVKKVAERLQVCRSAPYIFTVAGTNGKGTTCRTLEMILLSAGFNVGVYSSPHLIDYTERVRINNARLDDAKHVIAFDEIEKARGDISLTYFEYSTLSALWLFKQAKLDVVILEVGLGGRLDATNLVDADVAVITSIALDHIDYLGDSRMLIGAEKAGIFKHNSLAIIGDPDAPDSIALKIKEVGCSGYFVEPNPNASWYYQQHGDKWEFGYSIDNKKFVYGDLPVPSIHLGNAATALAALSYSSLTVDKSAIISGLMRTKLVGRFQKISDHPQIILDVAHNPHASAYLQKQINQLCQQQANNQSKIRIVMGMLKDKDVASTVALLHADVWYCASLYGERGCSADTLSSYIQSENKSSSPNVTQALESAIADATPNDIIIVCGSFYTVSEALIYLSQLNNRKVSEWLDE